MNIEEILSSQAQIAYPVGIEETVRRLSQKKGKTINFSIGQSGPETIPYDYFRDFFLSLSRASQEELKPLALYGATRGSSAGLEAVKKLARPQKFFAPGLVQKISDHGSLSSILWSFPGK